MNAARQNSVSRLSGAKVMLPYVEFALAVLAAELWYLQGGAVWYAGSWPGPWPLAVLGAAWLLRLARTGVAWRWSRFDLPLWAFLASGAVGVWVAYDRGPAWAALWLVVGALGLYYAIASQPDLQHLVAILAFWGVFAAGFALYFLATNDWSSSAKVPLLAAFGKSIQARLPALSAHHVTPNVAGGILAVIMPLYVVLVAVGHKSVLADSRLQIAVWRCVWAVAGCVAALGWLASMSRGAWMGALAAAGLWGLWRGAGWWSRRLQSQPERVWRLRLALMRVILVMGLLLALVGAYLVLSGRLPGQGALINRLTLMRDALLLARDYVLIGAGLGMFPMQFSTYTLLIHVGYIIYSHNMLLSILVAQGVLGLVPYLWLIVAAALWGVGQLRHADGDHAWIIEAALASLVVMLVHGFVDDVLYGSRAALLMFLPLAMLWASRSQGQAAASAPGARQGWPRVLVACVLVGLVALVAVGWRTILGAWYANLGAIAQARVELNVYDQKTFDKLTMDQVRQAQNLDVALHWFTLARQADPRNATARQRLAGIYLARAQYDQALVEMQAAWDVGYRDSVTRSLYGDALVAAGKTQEAAQVVRGLTWAETRLQGQAWSRYWLGKDYRRAVDAWATLVLLNPRDQNAAYWRGEAAKHLGKEP